MRRTHSATLLGLLALTGPVQAHHSSAMFDRSKEVILEGTVKEFRFTNPHSWIFLQVGSGAASGEWQLEGGSISALARNGWTKNSVKVGDKIKVVVFQRRDGANGGEFHDVTPYGGPVLHFTPQY